ncbi:hypothetical protein CONPUDRAFT_153352 [Coniophora puteana RWD-64-598 SS2]|uniref:Uncharacterized protein n=1 Tax=Coniophora puteana (strain RWD-64-598) TaxID=741705 RepID=A0A5M3MTI4_CONPW|nr:uncharacterized protein CONPUDRAFT_153352 [Coniophora puteana RWD-64-598 SS2]EIW82479.1 hypothetical protein CONPUDRAFT_153352 [Coniophora puteana RWD-64-598 SS2]
MNIAEATGSTQVPTRATVVGIIDLAVETEKAARSIELLDTKQHCPTLTQRDAAVSTPNTSSGTWAVAEMRTFRS